MKKQESKATHKPKDTGRRSGVADKEQQAVIPEETLFEDFGTRLATMPDDQRQRTVNQLQGMVGNQAVLRMLEGDESLLDDTRGKDGEGRDAENGIQRKKEGKPDGADVSQRAESGKVQRAVPAALAAIGGALATESAAHAAAAAGAILAGVQFGAVGIQAAAPVSTGVQSVALPEKWMTERDKQRLQLILQYRIVKAYLNNIMDRDWERGTTSERGQDEDLQPNEQEKAELDKALVASIALSESEKLKTALAGAAKTGQNQEFIWTDDNAHETGEWGTIGAIQFINVSGAALKETLTLPAMASDIPGLRLPSEGEEMVVKQFLGGAMVQGPSMEIGWGDTLAINVVGGAPQPKVAEDDGHGKMLFMTTWAWDGNTTNWSFNITIGDDGSPIIEDLTPEGVPDDFSWA